MKSLYVSILCVLALAGGPVCPVVAQSSAPQGDSLAQQYYQPMFDQPIDPALYLIRPGDKIRVTFLRTNLLPLDIVVSPEGDIIHPSLGLVRAGGLTLAEVREKLKAPLALQYNAKDIAITVTDPRQVVVVVTGAVVKPGRYRMLNSEQVSQVIELAGGVRPGGSTRFILLTGGARKIDVDLDRATFLGDNSADPYLYAGTRVEVPSKTSNVVQVIGEVLEPREIELRQGDNLDTLVALAGGLTRTADFKKAMILGVADRDPHVDGNIKAGDIIKIPALGEGTPAGIAIFGEVKVPGRYFLQDGLLIDQLIKMAGGPTDQANLGRITIFRLAEADSWERAPHERYALDASLDQKLGAMSLHPNDSVVVPRKLGWVRVSGLVRVPGLVPFVDGKDAMYYLNAAGGTVNGANVKEAMVFNRISRVASVVPVTAIVHDGDEVSVQSAEQVP